MASVTNAADLSSAESPQRRLPGWLVAGAMASLGAGAVHATAIGVHREHRAAVWVFVAVAAAQIGVGALSLVRRSSALALAMAVANATALGGWVLAKTRGIAFVKGLDVAEPIQWTDGAAAALALAAVVFAAGSLLGGRRLAPSGAGASSSPRGPGRWALNGVGAVVAVVTLSSMVAAGSHHHAGQGGGGGHDHGTTEAAVGDDHADHSGGGHDDVTSEAAVGDDHADHGGGDDEGTSGAAAGEDDGDHGPAAAVPPQEYDPEKPIDLSGVPGVTPQQQAKAENLIAITLIRLPQWADYRTAEAAGYHSIGDGVTGHEHFVNWDMIDDDEALNPDKPESLVYDTTGGGRRLVSAMYMLDPGSTLDTVPDLGGKLTQWHIHDNLCFTRDPTAPRVAGITSSGGGCPAGLQKFTPVPMIHVWIEKHPCGPFAALEGVGAGQVKEGETHLCDHAHGAGGS